jgi:hypothetical protein
MLKKFLLGTALAVAFASAGYAQDMDDDAQMQGLERGENSALAHYDEGETPIGVPSWQPFVDSSEKCFWRLYWQVEDKDHTVHWRTRTSPIRCSNPPPKSFSNAYLEALDALHLTEDDVRKAAQKLGTENSTQQVLSCPQPDAPADPNVLNVVPMPDGDMVYVYRNGISLRCHGTKITAVVASSPPAASRNDRATDNKARDHNNQSTDKQKEKSDSKSRGDTEKSDAKSTGNSEHSNAKSAGAVEHANAKLEKNTDHATRTVVHEKSEVTHQIARTSEAGRMSGVHEGGMHAGRLGGGGFGGLGGMHSGGISGLGGVLLGGLGRL